MALQQARRDALIQSAPKSLSEESKKKLRKIPFQSQTFGGKILEIYKENVETNRDKLVDKAVNQQSKPFASTSSSGQKGKARKDIKKPPPSKNNNQKGGRSESSIPPRKGSRGGFPYRGSSSRGRGAPPGEGPPLAKNSETCSPLPLPLPNIPVGGRLAHFAKIGKP